MTPSRFSPGNRDANETALRDLLAAAGVEYRQCPEGFGADLLLLIAPMVFLEVKNPAHKWRLTKRERETKEHCEMVGIPYRIVETEEQLLAIVGHNAGAAGGVVRSHRKVTPVVNSTDLPSTAK